MANYGDKVFECLMESLKFIIPKATYLPAPAKQRGKNESDIIST